jgi:hypothetical protein
MCNQCEKNPVYEFTNKRKLCKNCFINYFNKKILYTIRKFGMLKDRNSKEYTIGYKEKKDFRSVVLKEVLTILSKKLMITPLKLPSKIKPRKIAIETTIDLEARKIIEELINGKAKNFKRPMTEKKIIKPLYLFLDEEVLLYAKLKKLKYNKIKKPNHKIEKFLNELQTKHPEVKRAILNSYLELYN